MGTTQRTVAGWILEERLGSGGFGEVWRARKRHVDLQRALKLIPVASRKAFESWRHEISQLESLSHPNIVRFYDADLVTEDSPYREHAWIATELCDHSLADELHRRPDHRLRPEECEPLLDGMLAALAAAHEGASVHRDIKPANILRHTSGAWKLCDFGTARLVPQGESHPHTSVVGTSPYMSAGALRGRQSYAADLYALGVTVHEALCGQRLHPRPDSMSDGEFVKHILDTPPTVSPDLPYRWRTVIEALIAPDQGAGDRADHVAEVRDWFRRTRGSVPFVLPDRPAADPQQARTTIAHPALTETRAAGDEQAAPAVDDRLPTEAPELQAPGLQAPTEVQAPTGTRPGEEPRRATMVQPQAGPPQVWVPAPVAPPAPPPGQPGQGPAPAGPEPQDRAERQDDPWAPTQVLGRRAVAFCVDVIVIYLASTLIWAVAYAGLLLVAYDHVDDPTPAGDPTADPIGLCTTAINQSLAADCRVFPDVLGAETPLSGDVFLRQEGRLWTSGQIGTLAAGFVVLLLLVARQGRRGTTPGKKLTGVRTTGPDGLPPGRGRALVRTLLLPVDVFVWPFLIASASPENARQARRRVGDRVANTWVMRKGPHPW